MRAQKWLVVQSQMPGPRLIAFKSLAHVGLPPFAPHTGADEIIGVKANG